MRFCGELCVTPSKYTVLMILSKSTQRSTCRGDSVALASLRASESLTNRRISGAMFAAPLPSPFYFLQDHIGIRSGKITCITNILPSIENITIFVTNVKTLLINITTFVTNALTLLINITSFIENITTFVSNGLTLLINIPQFIKNITIFVTNIKIFVDSITACFQVNEVHR